MPIDPSSSRVHAARPHSAKQPARRPATATLLQALEPRQLLSAVTLDFEAPDVGPNLTQPTIEQLGYTLSDQGWATGNIQTHGTNAGYDSTIVQNQRWSRGILLERADGEPFDLLSLDHAAGRWGAASDAIITGTMADGTVLTATAASDTKTLTTLDLGWTNLTSVLLNDQGGSTNAYSAFDNLVVDSASTEPRPGRLAIDPSSITVNEGDGSVTLNVLRTSGTAGTVSATVRTANGTATAGTDYTALDTTVTLLDGETQRTVTIALLDDADTEGTEDFTVELLNPTGGAELGNDTSTVTVTDNELGPTTTIDFDGLGASNQGPAYEADGFRFSDRGWATQDLVTYDSDAGYAGTVLQNNRWSRGIEVTRVDGQPFDLAAFDYAAGRWGAATDATVTGTLPDGTTLTASFTTATKDLATLDLNWTGLASVLIDFNGGATNAYGAVTNFVVGNDAEPQPQHGTVNVSLDAITRSEADGSLTVVVFRSGGSDGEVTIDYATVPGTATPGEDYEHVAGTFTFADGQTEQSIQLDLYDDDLDEPDETFAFTLSNPTGGVTLGPLTTEAITLADDDEPFAGVLFSDGFEGADLWTTDYDNTDTATTGFWAAGAPQPTTSGGVNLQLGAGATGARALITGLAAGSSAGFDDVDNGTTSAASPFIDLPAGREISLSFSYYLAYLDNATADDHFHLKVLTDDGTLTAVYDDHAHAADNPGNWQSVTVDLSSFAGQRIRLVAQAMDQQGASLVEAGLDDVVVEVLPNQPGTLGFASTQVSVSEDAGTATVTLTRTAGRVGTVTVDYATASGSATTDDYTPTSGTVTFLDGETTKTVTIPITDDAIEEALESFTLQLSNPTGGALLAAEPAATITIADNDNTQVDFLPDMTPIASTLTEALRIDTSEQPGRRLMRFSTEVANAGTGPLEIWGGTASGDTQQVFQRVYQPDGQSRDRLAGEFVYHPSHGHIHFEGFATYDMVLTDGSGNIVASGGKTSFCLINIRNPFPDVTANADLVHGRGGSSCGNVQGISAGYSDVYGSNLDDQWIDVTDVPDGTYWLEIETDPDNNILESDETNNTARVQVRLENGNVTAL